MKSTDHYWMNAKKPSINNHSEYSQIEQYSVQSSVDFKKVGLGKAKRDPSKLKGQNLTSVTQ